MDIELFSLTSRRFAFQPDYSSSCPWHSCFLNTKTLLDVIDQKKMVISQIVNYWVNYSVGLGLFRDHTDMN